MRESGLPDPLWSDGEITLRIRSNSTGADRIVRVRRPYALLGRAPGADVRIDDPRVSRRHLYLHLDHRGLYVVDLLSRTGTCDQEGPISTVWLRTGQRLELAGHELELIELKLKGNPFEPIPCFDDPIAEHSAPDALQVRLDPRSPKESRWVLNSELVFLGRSAECGIRVESGSAARIHAVITRTMRGVYLVDIIGRFLNHNRRPIRGVACLRDGDILTVGSSEFTVKIEQNAIAKVPDVISNVPAIIESVAVLPATSTAVMPFGHESMLMPRNFQASPAETQEAFLAWLFGLFQAGQGELLRRQGEFQVAMSDAMQVMREENATILQEHLKKMEQIQTEIVSLKDQITDIDSPQAEIEESQEPTEPRLAPIKLPKRPDGPASPAASMESSAWLLNRIGALEEESKSSWRNLFSRLNSSTRKND